MIGIFIFLFEYILYIPSWNCVICFFQIPGKLLVSRKRPCIQEALNKNVVNGKVFYNLFMNSRNEMVIETLDIFILYQLGSV